MAWLAAKPNAAALIARRTKGFMAPSCVCGFARVLGSGCLANELDRSMVMQPFGTGRRGGRFATLRAAHPSTE